MGLIQREIERTGIPTIGISIDRRLSEKVKPPRTIFLDWPFGHPLGEPYNTAQQRTVLAAAFNNLYAIDIPGTIIDLPFRWRREEYRSDKLTVLIIDLLLITFWSPLTTWIPHWIK
ncbi:MAG: hypothetical protein JRI85_03920 [Deltaproteobacteria bacterium]|nr:hypothetical protein [Deltaproteobacteria bacterium]